MKHAEIRAYTNFCDSMLNWDASCCKIRVSTHTYTFYKDPKWLNVAYLIKRRSSLIKILNNKLTVKRVLLWQLISSDTWVFCKVSSRLRVNQSIADIIMFIYVYVMSVWCLLSHLLWYKILHNLDPTKIYP